MGKERFDCEGTRQVCSLLGRSFVRAKWYCPYRPYHPVGFGRCNDLVNLQVLCDTCNLKKSIGAWPVTSSVPPCLERALKRRNRTNLNKSQTANITVI